MSRTATARPSTRDLADFVRNAEHPETDRAIRAALDLIAAHTTSYATAAKLSYMRRLAREAVYVAVSAGDAAALEARTRLDRAITHETDPTGAFREALWPLLAEIVASRQQDRRDFRAAELRRAGDLSHLSPTEQAYHREIRAWFRAFSAPAGA